VQRSVGPSGYAAPGNISLRLGENRGKANLIFVLEY
jgi:hypothetical protein